jgi:hypothetical protein
MIVCGSMIIHNAVEFDYPVDLALRSLLPYCEEVVVMDCESTDSTMDVLRSIEDPRLTIKTGPWNPNTGGRGSWLADLSNLAKSHCKPHTIHVALQADEILWGMYPETFHAHLEKSFYGQLRRLNFWIDPWHIAPPNRVCGHRVNRIGPSSCKYIGDAENLEMVNPPLWNQPAIYHYGMIRKPDSFCAKAKKMETAFFGAYNPLIEVIQERPSEGFSAHVPLEDCELFTGQHPDIIVPWLKARGYSV